MPGPYCYEYPRPAVTVDIVVVHRETDNETLRVLLVRRKAEPFAGCWALPGGFVGIDEPIETAARRELKEETAVDDLGPLTFLGVYGAPGRDPRGRTISLAHVVLLTGEAPEIQGGDDAEEAAWFDPDALPSLAFDHQAILAQGLATVRSTRS